MSAGVEDAAIFVDALHVDMQLLFQHFQLPVVVHHWVGFASFEIVVYLLEYPWSAEGGSANHHGVNTIFVKGMLYILG